MSAGPAKPKSNYLLFAVFGLTVAFLVLSIHQYYSARVQSVANQELLAELRAAKLAEQATAAHTGDWPQWRGPDRDGISREKNLMLDWPANGLRLLWKKPAGEGYSSMAVASGRLYTMMQQGNEEAIVCLDAGTGEQVWRYGYPARYVSDQGIGPRSTPSVDGSRVYAVGATGVLHCLDAATGNMIWQHDLLKEFQASNLQWGVSFSPLVEGNLVYTNPGGPRGKSMAAFDKSDGRLVWTSGDDIAGYSSPVAITAAGVRQILFFTGKALVSVNPEDGMIYWRVPWDTSYDANIATPIAIGDYVFISSGYGKGCGLLKIVRRGEALAAQTVYNNNQMRNHFSSSVLYRDHLYGFDDTMLVCMELRTGEVTWKERGFFKGSLLIADGRLIVLGEENGKLALADATPEAYREKASFRAAHGRCWTVPVLAGGRLYLRDQEHLICYEMRNLATAGSSTH
jgi:outer membrane protein assembly factor BamB